MKAGEAFQADVYALNVEELTAWELRIDYDPKVISVEAADFDHFLLEDPSSGNVSPKLFVRDSPGRVFLGAAEVRSPESGSGVLARLDIKAVGNGNSPLTIVAQPTVYGPRLTAAGGVAMADTNGDGFWDGSVTGGAVAVGQSCSGSTPVITPTPVPGGSSTPRPTSAPRASATPKPSGGGSSGADDGSDDDGGNGSDPGEGSVLEVPGQGGSGDEPSSGNSDPGSDPETGADPGAGEPGANSNDDPDDAAGVGGAEGDASRQPAASGDGGGGGNTLVLVIGAMAASAVALGGLLLLIWRRGLTE